MHEENTGIEQVAHDHAALVIERLGPLSDIDFGLNEESVAWVAGFIERQRVRDGGGAHDGLVSVLGSFLGECLIARYGGRWEEIDGRWGVRFAQGSAAFPFAKVTKQFDTGIAGGDSILGFFRAVPVVMTISERPPDPGATP
jgi:hypothetical protein